jgi:hypothetical protein
MSRLRLRFNQCPACGRWVCDDCFCMNTGPDGAGLCGECNAQFL